MKGCFKTVLANGYPLIPDSLMFIGHPGLERLVNQFCEVVFWMVHVVKVVALHSIVFRLCAQDDRNLSPQLESRYAGKPQ